MPNSGARRNSRSGREWTTVEDAAVRRAAAKNRLENYRPRKSRTIESHLQVLARRLNRSEGAVRTRAHHLKARSYA